MNTSVSKQQVDAGYAGLTAWATQHGAAVVINNQTASEHKLRDLVGAIILGLQNETKDATRFFPENSDPVQTGEAYKEG